MLLSGRAEMRLPAVCRCGLALLAALALPAPAPAAETAPEGFEFFETKIRPILVENCHRCHAGARPKAGLHLDSREGLLRGGDSGPAVVLGRPDRSLLVKAIGYQDPELRMPPKSKLATGQVADLDGADF